MNIEFRIIAADAEDVIIHFKLSDMSVGEFAAQIDVSAVKFDFSPEICKRFSEEFNIAFFGSPVRVKVADTEDLGFFTIGELIQDGGPGFTG